ncbi:MAG: beta galactosidase jelly roll domain-containing protein, partial [Acidobacteriota bacterium]
MHFESAASRRAFGRLGFLALVILLASWPAFSSMRVNLDGFWQFKVDPSNRGESAGWSKARPSDTTMVRVPGAWSNMRKYYFYVGHAWYFKTFTFPEAPSDERVEIHFGATFYKSHVWLNGTELGSHEGGYTGYFFNVMPYLKPVNYLAVEIDNSPGMGTIPGWAMKYAHQPDKWYDWWPDGGIVRPVWLKVSAPQLVRWQQILGTVSGTGAIVTDHVHLENYGSSAAQVQLSLKVLGPDGNLAASSTQSLSLAPGKNVV